MVGYVPVESSASIHKVPNEDYRNHLVKQKALIASEIWDNFLQVFLSRPCKKKKQFTGNTFWHRFHSVLLVHGRINFPAQKLSPTLDGTAVD